MDWIDLVLAGSEEELDTSLSSLNAAALQRLTNEAIGSLRLNREELDRSLLRILLERLRPHALPSFLWSQRSTEAAGVAAAIRVHLAEKGFEPTEDRVRRCQALYSRYVETRGGSRYGISHELMEKGGWACAHCGIRFYNEELGEKTDIVSPLGYRNGEKSDTLKRHWIDLKYRLPTVDHIWPIATFGSNDLSNLQILCVGCNSGKHNALAYEQGRSFVGVHQRKDLSGGEALSFELFYEHLLLNPRCVETGALARDTELTVRIRDVRWPVVMGNLETIRSPEV